MITKCPVCKSAKIKKGIEYLNYFWTDEEELNDLSISLCFDCGMGFVEPSLRKKYLEYFYNEKYRSRSSAFYIDFSTFLINKNDIDSRSLSQLILAKSFTTWETGDYFLDVGAGSGLSYNTAHHLFASPKLIAIESNKSAIKFYTKQFKDIITFPSLHEVENSIGQNSVKVILLSHSLEHFQHDDLIKELQSLYKLLMPGGVLVIEVPFNDFRKNNHLEMRYNDAPHLCFFSLESLSIMMEKAGFKIPFINTTGPFYHDSFGTDKFKLNTPYKSTLKKTKRFIKYVPKNIRLFKRSFLKKISNDFCIKSVYDLFASQNFVYGGDRVHLRCAAIKPN